MPDGTRPPVRLAVQSAPGVPVERLVIGRPVGEVLALVPRLFNLCRGAQEAAMLASLGRAADGATIGREVLRDHLVKFCLTWPGLLGRAPSPLPSGWERGGRALLATLFGPATTAPRTPEDFAAFLSGGAPLADVLARIATRFGAGEAVADGLPPVTARTIWDKGPVENSVALRHSDHPVMREIARATGRGPLWRATARLYDIEAALLGHLPAIQRAKGAAVVPAARGAYGVRIAARDGRVTAFARVTPTDALLAPGGVLESSLATLPADKTAQAALMLDILDPCLPVRLREVCNA